MPKLFVLITLLVTTIANSQITKDDFETAYPKVKEVNVMSEKLELGYQDQYISESDPIAYKVNGVYVRYENKKWFIPYKNIESIGPNGKVGLLIYLKS
jgi:hypothetical protein